MATEVVQITRRGFGKTMRSDAWWVQPLVVFIILTAFLVYATWAAFQNKYYSFRNYLSPFYSPLLYADSPHAWIHGTRPWWIPGFLPFTPALLILPFPAGFRLTCYYYRGAYYKAFWADPPSCAVGEPRHDYRGEQFGVALGTLVLCLNVVLLGGYTFGCHSLRHIVGGAWDVLSNKPIRRTA